VCWSGLLARGAADSKKADKRKMEMSHYLARTAIRIVGSSLIALLLVTGVGYSQTPGRLTFLGWSDQHVQTDGDGGHLVPAILGMNGLVGRGYPAGVGGVVRLLFLGWGILRSGLLVRPGIRMSGSSRSG